MVGLRAGLYLAWYFLTLCRPPFLTALAWGVVYALFAIDSVILTLFYRTDEPRYIPKRLRRKAITMSIISRWACAWAGAAFDAIDHWIANLKTRKRRRYLTNTRSRTRSRYYYRRATGHSRRTQRQKTCFAICHKFSRDRQPGHAWVLVSRFYRRL